MDSPSSSSSSSTSTSSSSSRSSPVHHASLVDPATHSPALLDLIDVKISRSLIEYVVECVSETVDYAMGRPSSSSRGRTTRPANKTFTTFVTNVITRAEITTPVLLASLVYIDRAKPHLHIALEEWALERVFLGAVIVASKYLNDSTLKNVHWALCTGVFGKRDVGRIEREFLDVLDFELGIAEDDLLSHHDGISAATGLASHVHYAHEHEKTHASVRAHKQHHHRHRHASVPELEPSSPQSSSSAGDSSPRTPSTLASPSPLTLQKPHVPSSSTSSSEAAPPHKPAAPTKKSSFQATTLELLRSFPIPLPTHHHHHTSHHHSNPTSQSHSQFPIRIAA